MKKYLVTGNSKMLKGDLENTIFVSRKNFYKVCLDVVCGKAPFSKIYVDITDVKNVDEIEDFVKCLFFFKNESKIKEVFVECDKLTKMLLENIPFDRYIIGRGNCYIVSK